MYIHVQCYTIHGSWERGMGRALIIFSHLSLDCKMITKYATSHAAAYSINHIHIHVPTCKYLAPH